MLSHCSTLMFAMNEVLHKTILLSGNGNDQNSQGGYFRKFFGQGGYFTGSFEF